MLLVSVLAFSSFLDLFIGSASAKWSALAPVVVPMFMLLGISPEMTTAAYRMGDSYTNIMTPLMSYFPLILVFARRWDTTFGVGSLLEELPDGQALGEQGERELVVPVAERGCQCPVERFVRAVHFTPSCQSGRFSSQPVGGRLQQDVAYPGFGQLLQDA